MDVVDDIEGQLEEVSRLKRWGHFNDALDYFRVNLEDHLDLPLVAIGYANLLLEQGSYKQVVDFISSRQPHPPKRTKCIPIGNGAVGRDLYETHINLLQLRARLSFESLSSRELELLQLDFHSFVQYLEERAYSRHVDRLSIARGMPIDPTEVKCTA
ncbi:hypothetical protein N7510_008835 [Penicillium lagena]|uniref:uncharacterized protein n=1 Tax=Penicillium lagena TaxID=94218 RepID=UPI0025402BF9|nr:uncharacterized protein N7510_008835 [Penicillium lagena]KAJ5606054.1 hypothetical protein N7510_008835 [Penicillium lagena]